MDTKRYLEEDFNDFIQELLNNKSLTDSTEKGIAKLVIDKGFDFQTD
jgi:hypothetical protein